jgi:threonine dehydrogenase-like Zn-dependent dehydrogenase
MVVDEVTLVGSRCGPFAKAIALLASGRLNLRPLLSEMMPLEKGVAAIARARDKNVLKIILKE